MAKLFNGYEGISVELINFGGRELGKLCWEFGKHGEFYTYKSKYEETPQDTLKSFYDDIMTGRTFPKFLFEGTTVSFKINNISRICLAQLTREKGFFCSESGAVRPLTQEIILPKAIYANEKWRDKIQKINEELEDLYCEMGDSGITYLDARYFMPHGQTISISYCTTLIDFVKSCNKRTDNCFNDEINYIYKLMRHSLQDYIKFNCDGNTQYLMAWLLDKSYNKGPHHNLTYGNDVNEFKKDETFTYKETPHNNFEKSSWLLELEKMAEEQPYLLTDTEKTMLNKWKKGDVITEYNPNAEFTFETKIKQMPYYRKR